MQRLLGLFELDVGRLQGFPELCGLGQSRLFFSPRRLQFVCHVFELSVAAVYGFLCFGKLLNLD